MNKPSRFNLRQIEAFRAVMVEGSITKAALSLHISQPAVSQLLRSAEDQLRFKLFERSRGRLLPTREARILFAETEDLVAALERVQRQGENLRRRHEASIDLLISPSLSLSLLPPALLSYRQSWPTVRLSCEPLGYREIVARLTKEQSDLGIAVGPQDEENLDTVLIGRVSLVCALPASHPLCSQEVITPKDLEGEKLISYRKDSAIENRIQAAYDDVGVTLSSATVVPFGSTALDFVRIGLGVAVIDSLTARTARDGVALRPFSPVQTLDVAVLYHTKTLLTKPINDLIKTLKHEARTSIGWK